MKIELCEHSDSGWCFACVEDLRDRHAWAKRDSDLMEAMSICWAAEEFLAERISLADFKATVAEAVR